MTEQIRRYFSISVAALVAFLPLFIYYKRLSKSSDPQVAITLGFLIVFSFFIFFILLVSFFYFLKIRSYFRLIFLFAFMGILGCQLICLAVKTCAYINLLNWVLFSKTSE